MTMPPELHVERADVWESLGVPREAYAKLQRYEVLLREWNERFNLVAASTLPHIWTRHFLDSAQLYPLLGAKKAQKLIDLGSGAGFPGLVLAILGGFETHLIESIGKKATFLDAVTRDLGLNVTVHNARIEAVRDLQADVITARALTALPDLLSLAKPFMKADTLALFLKGERADAELTEAAKYWTFTHEKKRSLSDPSGTVLAISDVKVLRPYVHKRKSK